jgi:hypothetical protein
MEILSTRNYKAGYKVQKERHLVGDDNESVVIRSAYTPEGLYVGDPRTARFLILKRGIKPELADPNDNVCSVGFNEKEQVWYGWSHRAICGFAVGDALFVEDYEGATDDTPFKEHGEVVIETLVQARQAAVNFARYVS